MKYTSFLLDDARISNSDFFDDRDCHKFIQKHYSRLVVEAYDYLIPKIRK